MLAAAGLTFWYSLAFDFFMCKAEHANDLVPKISVAIQ